VKIHKQYKAFTLAEATLTLFVLSVIAAVMIPAATNVSPDQFKTSLRNAYSITSNTVNTLINNENLYPSKELISDSILIPKGFLYETTGTKHTFDSNNNITTYSETNDIAWEYESLLKNCKCTTSTKLVNAFCCSLNVSAASCTSTKCNFTTNNGMYWTVTQNSDITTDNRNTTPILYVEVDVNGSGKPNSKTATSPDQYKFSVYYNGRVDLFTSSSADDYNTSTEKAREYLESPTKNKKKT